MEQASNQIKTGLRIGVRQFRVGGEVLEPAKVARTTASMGRIPDGYLPVRFDDGARLLVHIDSIVINGAE